MLKAIPYKRLSPEAIKLPKRSMKGVVEFVPQIGDFVAVDDPLFYLYSDAYPVDEDRLRSSVAFGSERSMDQDPTFAFRIVVDVGLKALSPAINDPTTAVLAMDQLHRMLRTVGKRHLRADELPDQSGQLRLIFRTPNWDDFVYLAFSEIRNCGSNNLQIVRRMRAMIENLMQTLPPNRHEALFRQLSLLDREIGDNTMEQVLDWEIGEFKRSIVMNEAGVKQRERAVELLRDYDFAQDISTRAFTIRRGRIPSDRDPGG